MLADKDIVKALNLAVNKQEIIDKIFAGKAIMANGPILPVISGYNNLSNPENEFSIEKANEILDKAGWTANPETNIREKNKSKQAEQLEFSIIVPQIPFLAETAEIIKNNWEKIGIKLNTIAINPSDITNEILKNRNYEMILFGNILKNNPDIFAFWHSSQRFYPGLNLSLYENKKIDSLLESIRKNPDENSRKEELSQLQKTMGEDSPAIFLYSPLYIYIAPKILADLMKNNKYPIRTV